MPGFSPNTILRLQKRQVFEKRPFVADLDRVASFLDDHLTLSRTWDRHGIPVSRSSGSLGRKATQECFCSMAVTRNLSCIS